MQDVVDDYDGYDAEDAAYEAPARGAGASGPVVISPELSAAAEKRRVREQLQADIEAFLRSGGAVQNVADNFRADPPKKPDIQYGSSPI
ncbi:MAG: hypothetical protein IPM37_10975 [Hahellaceae bacterium]|nr:hypothetical protein [Hahellaceae bacterium]